MRNGSRAVALLCVTLIAVAPGCGSILGYAGDAELHVLTNPAGAELFVDSIPRQGLSPCVVLLDPAEEHRLDARFEDLRGSSQVTRSTRTGVIVANIAFTAGLGLLVDWLTGALYHFPERLVLNLGRPYDRDDRPLAAQYPPAPRLMPHTDPVAPARPLASPCAICGEPTAAEQTCRQCGQPPVRKTTNVLRRVD
jgi:hypothetical protein